MFKKIKLHKTKRNKKEAMQLNTFQISCEIDRNSHETSISMLPAQNLLYRYNLHS